MTMSYSAARTLPPNGFQDTLPDACSFVQSIRDRLRALFEGWGYRAIETPMLETYDLFATGPGTLPQQRMWKTVASDGRILVLRPDSTVPAVRLACSRLGDSPLPIRLYYQQSVLRYPGADHNVKEAAESRQAGIELLGETRPEADAEAVGLAVRSMRESGLSDFRVDIGHVGFFKGLMEEAGLSAAAAEHLRAMVEEKNQLAIELMLREWDADGARGKIAERILRLPTLFGGAEVIAEARGMSDNSACIAALDNLEAVFNLLREDGLERFISIDLGMVHEIEYYTGIVFRGLTGSIGLPLLSGGRYDTLPASMGRALGAVGLGISLEAVTAALTRQGARRDVPKAHAVIGYAASTGARTRALAAADSMRASGRIVLLDYSGTAAGVRERARAECSEKWLFIE